MNAKSVGIVKVTIPNAKITRLGGQYWLKLSDLCGHTGHKAVELIRLFADQFTGYKNHGFVRLVAERKLYRVKLNRALTMVKRMDWHSVSVPTTFAANVLKQHDLLTDDHESLANCLKRRGTCTMIFAAAFRPTVLKWVRALQGTYKGRLGYKIMSPTGSPDDQRLVLIVWHELRFEVEWAGGLSMTESFLRKRGFINPLARIPNYQVKERIPFLIRREPYASYANNAAPTRTRERTDEVVYIKGRRYEPQPSFEKRAKRKSRYSDNEQRIEKLLAALRQ